MAGTIKYVCFFILFVSIVNHINAQILYTDFEPDVVINADYPQILICPDSTVMEPPKYDNFYIDLNQDSIYDYKLYSERSLCYMSPLLGWADCYDAGIISLKIDSKVAYQNIQGTWNSTCWNVELDSGEVINDSLLWKDNNQFSYAETYSYGWDICEITHSVKFFALNFFKDSSYFFGWYRLKAFEGKLILYDMAINLTPGESIVAGQTFINSIEETSNGDFFKIFPNPAGVEFNIRIPDKLKNGSDLTVSIFDFIGRLKKKMDVDAMNEIIKVNMGKESKGIYNVVISDNSNFVSGKIIIE